MTTRKPAKVKQATLREQAKSFEFRNKLIRSAAWDMSGDNSDCSETAAMVLAVAHYIAVVNQFSLKDLLDRCNAEGITPIEFSCGCAELKARDLFLLFKSQRDGSAVVKFWNIPETVEGVNLAKAIARLN